MIIIFKIFYFAFTIIMTISSISIMPNEIQNFFYPKTICVAGASTKEKSIGYELLNTIKNYGFTGEIFPVNPKADEILGTKCYKSIDEIDSGIDLAIIAVPKKFVEDTVDALLGKKVKSIILITAGFREVGEEGEEFEKLITEKINSTGARMVGPNCMGVINTLEEIRLNATFVAEKPESGKTGFLSQSGALGAAVLNSLRETDIKFAHFISVGNKADINENDIVQYWQKDDNIEVITLYLESFEDGMGLVENYLTSEKNKPVIVLKAGRTSAGIRAASSHTGAMGSQDRVVDSVLKQYGIIRAEDLNELFNTAKGFENFPIPKGNKIAVVTNAGGPAILAVDSLEKEGLVLAQFKEETKERLREIVHPEGSINNPVDLLPGGDTETYKQVNELAAGDPNVDAVVSIFVEPVMVQPFDLVEGITTIASDKPIMQVVMPLPEFWEYYRRNSQTRKPLFKNPEDPSKVIANMLSYSNFRSNFSHYIKLLQTIQIKNKTDKIELENGFLPQDDVHDVCDTYGLPMPESIVLSPENIKHEEISFYPVVLKGLSNEAVHKSDVKGVKVGINNKVELLHAKYDIEANFMANNLKVEEFLIQKCYEPKHELLLGGFRDSSFGPILMFGQGGKYVETYNDTAVRSMLLSVDEMDSLIDSTKIGQILRGVRGEKSISIYDLKLIMMYFNNMFLENPSMKEIDINPLILTKDGDFIAADVRIRIE